MRKPGFLTLSSIETMMKERETPKRLPHLATVQQKYVTNFIESIVIRLLYILCKTKVI